MIVYASQCSINGDFSFRPSYQIDNILDMQDVGKQFVFYFKLRYNVFRYGPHHIDLRSTFATFDQIVNNNNICVLHFKFYNIVNKYSGIIRGIYVLKKIPRVSQEL